MSRQHARVKSEARQRERALLRTPSYKARGVYLQLS